jgi:hypothetical protein
VRVGYGSSALIGINFRADAEYDPCTELNNQCALDREQRVFAKQADTAGK